jgi:hypothetical protein
MPVPLSSSTRKPPILRAVGSYEQAEACWRMRAEGLSPLQIANTTKLSLTHVQNLLRLRNLSAEHKKLFASGDLSMRQAIRAVGRGEPFTGPLSVRRWNQLLREYINLPPSDVRKGAMDALMRLRYQD